jgi:hypothetical protein
MPPQPLMERIEPSQVRKWLEQAMSSPVEQVILLGTRGGYAIDLLLHEYDLRNLVIIEKDFSRLWQVFQNVDLTRALVNPNVFWVVGFSSDDLEDGLEYCKTFLAAVGFQLLQDPSSWRESTPYYVEVLKELKRIMEQESFHLQARLARGNLVQRNLISNLPVSLSSTLPDQVSGLFQNVPAIIVAAGPSLDRNVQELKQMQDSALIISVDTSLRTLLKHEIQPHMVVTLDPSPDNADHFQGIQFPAGTAFAFVPDSYYTIPSDLQYVLPRICLFDDSSHLTFKLKDLLSFQQTLKRSIHVGECAIRLAVLLGCNPIVFTGLDLALSSDSDLTHAENSARVCRILSRRDDEIRVELPNGKEVSHSLAEVPGMYGTPVKTFYAFKIYLERIEELIATTPKRWIDATEGGAFKEGSEIRTLREVIQEFHGRNHSIWDRIRSIQPGTDKGKYCCTACFEGAMQRIRLIAEQLHKVASGQVGEETAGEIWQRFVMDEDMRMMLDHAVFRFQIYSRVHQMPPQKRWEFLQIRSQEASQIIQMFLPLWENTIRQLQRTSDL